MIDQDVLERIAQCRKYANDDSMCGVDIGRSGPCHADWYWDEVADTLQSLLDENEALREVADAAKDLDAVYYIRESFEGEIVDRFVEALAKWEALNEKP